MPPPHMCPHFIYVSCPCIISVHVFIFVSFPYISHLYICYFLVYVSTPCVFFFYVYWKKVKVDVCPAMVSNNRLSQKQEKKKRAKQKGKLVYNYLRSSSKCRKRLFINIFLNGLSLSISFFTICLLLGMYFSPL